MPKASAVQNTFNSGEMSPLMLGRQDVDKYGSGLNTCFNAVVLPQGPWTRRGGSLFQHTTKFGGSKESRLLPFSFSTTQNYILEFGDLYVRFHTLHGILVGTSQIPTVLTKADPGVVTIVGHGYSDGDRVHAYDFDDGMEELNGSEFIVASKTADTFELTDIYGADVDTTNYTTWASGGKFAEPIQVTTTYTEAELPDIRVVQSADTLYIFHPDHETAKLVRTTATTWALSDTDIDDGPYLAENTETTTLTLSGTSGSVNVTASALTGINDGAGFLSTDVGRLIRWKDPANDWTWLEITALTSTTIVVATIFGPNASAGTATTSWRLGLWSDTTGYPVTGTFFEDRLWAGGAAIAPQRLDSSKTGLYESFSPTDQDGVVADDHAVSFTLNSNDVNVIRWMFDDEKALLVGTAGGEWPVKPSSLSEATTPTNVSGKRSTRYGSAAVHPVRADKAVLFLQPAGRKVRELAYVFEADGFKAPDMTLLAEHITVPSVIDMDYQPEPFPIIWGVRSDGVLLSFTYEREQNVLAWARHELGGDGDDSGGIPIIESIAVIPEPNNAYHEVYMIVKRYINGTAERYIEYLTKIWETGDTQTAAFHLDAGGTATLSPAGTTVVVGRHLEGETLGVYADGAVHPDVTVTNAKITLQIASSIVTYGYSYDSDGEIMPIEAAAEDGTAQGKTKRIHHLAFWIMDTLGLKHGPSTAKLSEILIRRWGADYGAPTSLFTGVTHETFDGDYDRLGQIYWRCSGPFPATVMSVMPQLMVFDDG